MAIDFGSFKEHLDIIALVGVLFAVWSSRRILNSYDDSDKLQVAAIAALDKKLDDKVSSTNKLIQEMDTKREGSLVSVYQKIETVTAERDRKTDIALKELHKWLEDMVNDRHKEIQKVVDLVALEIKHNREERDKQVRELEKAFSELKGEHEGIQCGTDRRQNVIPGNYIPTRRITNEADNT
jgi:hypothetical protein